MSNTHTGQNVDSPPLPNAEAHPISRAKTVATRLFVEALTEVELAAKRDEKSLAEWLRDTILREARPRPVDPFEQILAEISACRVLSGQIAQQVSQSRQEIPRLVSQSADQALARVEDVTVKAIRNVTVSGVGAKIEPIAGRLATIENELQMLNRFSERAEEAATSGSSFSGIFQWQQLAVAVLAGIVIGVGGSWYFASRPLKEAADYILQLKENPVSPQNAPQSTPPAPRHPIRNQKPKSIQGTQPQ
jgi:hypothetical protein